MSVHVSVNTNDTNELLWACLLGGPILILWGLRRNALKREIQNTPTSKIRSAAMGRVELSGIARQRKAQTAPLSKLSCCWWQCSVQELQNSGKSSKWVTIRTAGSLDFFYLDDLTGRVLVNPIGAELKVLNTVHAVDSKTRSTLAPLLESWGVGSSRMFGLSSQMRILEQCLPDCAPVYVLGAMNVTKNDLQDRQTRFLQRLRKVKDDSDHMSRADENQDGAVSAEEWDAYRTKIEQEFLREELAKGNSGGPSEQMIVQAPAEGTYLISTGTEGDVTSSMEWRAPGAILGGLIATAIGVYWALTIHWSPIFIVVLVGIGVGAGSFIKK